MFIIKFFNRLFKSFMNIYDDKDVRESYGEKFADKLAGVNPVTGKRKISVVKILFRIVILVLLALFIFIFIRMNTATGYYINK